MPDWKAVRQEFPALENWTYLNTATYGQTPRCAVAAATGHFERRNREACSDFLSWFDDMDQVRADVGRLINAQASDIAFAPNAATALSWLLGGLDWQPGDRVVTLRGEFPNNIYAPASLHARDVEFIEADWNELRGAVEGGRTTLVLASTINYTNGFRAPVEEIAPWLRERGVLLYLDGTQSVGALRFDCAAIQPDMLAVHAYKWMLSPNGAGFAYVSPSLRQVLTPTIVGWRSDAGWREVDNLNHGAARHCSDAERYEGGMLNFPSLYAMGASVQMFLDIGPEEVERRVMHLASECACILERAGATIKHRGSPILAAVFPDRDASALARSLRDHRILVSARHGGLRVSVHLYNDESDLEALGAALR